MQEVQRRHYPRFQSGPVTLPTGRKKKKTKSLPSLVPNRVSSLQMEEPGDKANRYLCVILIVTNDNLQETEMQDDHPRLQPESNPSKESGCIQPGHQREDEPCERGPFLPQGMAKTRLPWTSPQKRMQDGQTTRSTEKWLDNRATETCNKNEKEARLQILMI